MRQQEIQENREDKFRSLHKKILEENTYLKKHARASVAAAIRRVVVKIKKLKMKWVQCEAHERNITIFKDIQILAKESELDGCYVIKTDLSTKISGSTSQDIHDRYKDLSQVEWAFRTMKTSHLELRPYYVRKTSRTEGHVFILMLAYRV